MKKEVKQAQSEVFRIVDEMKTYIKGHKNAYDVFAAEPLRLWECFNWMFPDHMTTNCPTLPTVGTMPCFIHTSKGNIKGVPEIKTSFEGAALIIANCPLPSHMEDLWQHSSMRLCADGGANRLYDWAHKGPHLHDADYYTPNYIIGDLDSVRPEVMNFYKSKGASAINLPSQDSTDLDKTLNYLDKMPDQDKYTHIMIVGALGGNASQEMANYHSCWAYPKRQIALIGELSVAFHLIPGSHIIQAARGIKCGILPLGNRCKSITTTGLKWDLNNSELSFGGLISSSNRTVSPEVTIRCTHPLLWTFDFAPSNF